MAPTPLRILYLEDNPTDSELVLRIFQREKLEADICVVTHREGYLAALGADVFDLILSDYSLPGYDGTAALAAARELRPETPFIFVTGTLGEELAVETLKKGASDYVLKTSLTRLASAVRRALRAVEEAKALKAADEAARRAGETLAFALDAAGMGTWDWNIATSELVWSDRCKAIFGIPAHEPMNYGRFLHAIHPDDRRRADAAVTRALADKTGYEIECRTLWPDGSVHWVVSKGHAFYDEATGKPTRMAGAAMDVTARKQSEEATRQSEALLRSITDHTDDLIFVKDLESRLVFMNPAGLHANGHSINELLGRTDAEWHDDPAEAARFMADDRRVMESGRTETFEEQFTSIDGMQHVFLTTKTPRLDPEGNVIGIIGIVHDITERVVADEMMRASERRWRDLAEAMPQLVWTCASDGKCDYLSRQWLEYTGVAEADQLGHGWLERVHPDDRDRLDEAWHEAVKEGHLFDVEFRIRRHDGEYHWFKTRAVPVPDAAGKIVKWFGSNTDIEDMKQAQAGLERERNLLRTLIDLIPDPIYVRDRAHRFLVANEAVSRAMGAASPNVLLGKTDADFFPAESAGEFRRDDERVLAGEPVLNKEEPIDFPDGKKRVLLTTKVPVKNVRGEVVGLVGIGRDITGRKAREEALRTAHDAVKRASKAKDEFLAALSHELRTPLTPVMLSAGTLRRDERLPPDVREQMEMIVRNIVLEARMIDDLLDLTRIARGSLAVRLERCDAHLLLRQTCEIVQSELAAKSLHLTEDFAAGRSWIEADPTRLQQVFWNLLRNAIKFTPAGGHVRLSTGHEGDRLVIKISDTGIGISSEMLGRIFEPFEQAGLANDHRFGGLGLGLAIAHAVIVQHQGKITAESEGPNRGATFRLELHAVAPPDEALATAPAPSEELQPQTRPLRLLIVEDHEPTLQTLARLLARGGHQITCASSIATAMEAGQAQAFDVLISDIGLPDGFGYDLLPQLRALQPALQAIVLSGYGAEEDTRKSREAGFYTHLTKPIDFAEVKRALHTVASAVAN